MEKTCENCNRAYGGVCQLCDESRNRWDQARCKVCGVTISNNKQICDHSEALKDVAVIE